MDITYEYLHTDKTSYVNKLYIRIFPYVSKKSLHTIKFLCNFGAKKRETLHTDPIRM